MQYSTLVSLKKTLPLRKISYLIKGIIFVAILAFIVLKLLDNPLKVESLLQVAEKLKSPEAVAVLVVFVFFTSLNWLLEAVKWQLLVSKLERISLGKGLKGVLTGLSLGFVTPHALGDYAGRIWQLRGESRTKSLGAIMLGRAAQYFATFTFGVFGIVYLFNSTFPFDYVFYWSFILVVMSFIVGCICFLYGRDPFLKFLSLNVLKPFRPYFTVVEEYTSGEILKILLLALMRYLVFATQFYLLLSFFNVSANGILLVAAVTWILLAKSSIPAFNFLSDLGNREFSALYFFSHFEVNEILVLSASFTLWCFNILVPAIAGLGGVASMKIFQK